MTIAVKCPKCKHIARVNDSLAGKAAKCPSCRGIVRIPAAEGAETPGSSPSQTRASSDAWYVRTPDGETFGPISRAEMDAWVGEDRIDAECYVLQKGSKEWYAAADVYPQLSAGAAAGTGISVGGGGASDADNPFSISTEDSSPGPRRLPPFQRRKYPAMTVVMYLFYVLAILTVISFLVTCIVTIISLGMLAAKYGMNPVMPILAGILSSLLLHGSILTLFVYMAETVKIILDIQSNTQEAAHYTRASLR